MRSKLKERKQNPEKKKRTFLETNYFGLLQAASILTPLLLKNEINTVKMKIVTETGVLRDDNLKRKEKVKKSTSSPFRDDGADDWLPTRVKTAKLGKTAKPTTEKR